MSYDESYAADVQAIAVVHSAGIPGAARKAEAKLARLHRDLPELANFTVDILAKSGIDVGASKASSHRLTEALMRETAVRQQGRLATFEKYDISRSAVNSVLVQEAAAYEYEARTGKMDTYRQWMGDRVTSNGIRAMSRLEARKVDLVGLYGQATDMELTQMSVGAFHRTGKAQQERLAKVLDLPDPRAEHRFEDLPGIDRESGPTTSPRGVPVRGTVTRHPNGIIRRSPVVFGKREPQNTAAATLGL
ncbi:hypothetical protein [Sphingomonas sp. 3-13AW]|uniref:hypothetical protein n=1 Tax=Sphingomonas sp. 3-13AW TaxID=3050450 RepID=UPI003BB6B0D8